MKIAIITSGFLPIMDGVTVSGLQRLKRLSQWGHEVILFCPDYSSLEDYFPLPKPIFVAIKYVLRKLIVWVYNSYDLTLVTSTVTYPKVMDLGIKNAKYTNLVGFDSDRFNFHAPQADFFWRNNRKYPAW